MRGGWKRDRADGSACGKVCRQHREDAEKNRLVDRMLLKQLIDELPEQEKILIRLRYYEDQTQAQIAQKLGISQVQVSRMEKKILIRMRERSGCRTAMRTA